MASSEFCLKITLIILAVVEMVLGTTYNIGVVLTCLIAGGLLIYAVLVKKTDLYQCLYWTHIILAVVLVVCVVLFILGYNHAFSYGMIYGHNAYHDGRLGILVPACILIGVVCAIVYFIGEYKGF